MENNKENILKPRLIGELTLPKNNYRFYIPSYQRGYRWGEEEVLALLNDFFEVLEKDTESYCLQPIVVKQVEDGRYEVLDGQQRLTTLFILLSYIKKDYKNVNLFSLEYETRTNSADFLNKISSIINDDNPDYYYISLAYNTISEWFEEKDRNYNDLRLEFYRFLIKKVEIIWYQIKDNTNPIDVFTRINIGKIPLTNSELVKAVFLSKENLEIGEAEQDQKIKETILNNKQSTIAFEWDAMEKQLQDKKFWNFIYKGSDDVYQTRIDYILDLATDSLNSSKDSLESFNKYYTKVREIRDNEEEIARLNQLNLSFIEDEWGKLKVYFDILLEWYHDKWYNHIIGFLISRNENVLSLLHDYMRLNKVDFKKIVIERVGTYCLMNELSNLSYSNGSDKKKIESILILHNVVSALLQPDTAIQFPFESFNRQWSLEHINAQNSEELKESDMPNWLEDHLFYLREEIKNDDQELAIIVQKIQDLQNKEGKIDNSVYIEEFRMIFEKVTDYIDKKNEVIREEEQDESEEKNFWRNDDDSIANLTLLDVGSNAYLSNSLFGVKRNKIKKLDMNMSFIPNETRKVFFKYFTDSSKHNSYWTEEDRKAYVEDIQSKLNNLDRLINL